MQPVINVIDMYHGNNASAQDFVSLKNNGVMAIIHKASEGTHYKDPLYAARRKMATDAGLLWGAYHFLHHGSIDDQVTFFLECAGVSDPNFGPPLLACDYEDCPAAASLGDCMSFMSGVDRASPPGVQCVLYSGNRIRETMPGPHAGGHQDQAMVGAMQFFQQHRLWLAEYGPHARTPWPWNEPIVKTSAGSTPLPAPGVWLWQFTEKGRISPLRGLTDGNFFPGTQEELAARWLA